MYFSNVKKPDVLFLFLRILTVNIAAMLLNLDPDIVHSGPRLRLTVFAVDDRHVTFCDFRGGVANFVCVTLATLANGNFLLH
jgi:hypothetical protein